MVLKLNDEIGKYLLSKKWIFLLLSIISTTAIFSNLLIYTKDGGSITSDTIAYFNMSYSWKQGIYPVSGGYSPGYPLFLAIISYLFSVTIETASVIAGYIIYAVTLVYTFKILAGIFELPKQYSLIFTLALISFKQVSSILLMAHADALMLCIHTLVLYYMISFIKSKSWFELLLLSLFLFLSLWVKSNNILYFIFVPAVLVLSLSKKDFFKYALVPIVSLAVSYILFKVFNGADNARIANSSLSNMNLLDPALFDLFLTNFRDFFLTIGDLIINPIISSRIPGFIISIFGGIIFLLLLFMTPRLNKNNKAFGFLLGYMCLYGFVFLIFQQMSYSKEVNNRTLITLAFTFFLFLYGLFFKGEFRYYTLLVFVLLMNTSFVLVSNYQNYRKENKETVNDIRIFNSRPSVSKFKTFVQNRKIKPLNVYSNERRMFSFALDCNLISAIPGEKYFYLGKMVTPDSTYIANKNSEIASGLKNKKAIVILFNYTENQRRIYRNMGDSSIQIGKDIIIF